MSTEPESPNAYLAPRRKRIPDVIAAVSLLMHQEAERVAVLDPLKAYECRLDADVVSMLASKWRKRLS